MEERWWDVTFSNGVSKLLPESYVRGIDNAYVQFRDLGQDTPFRFKDGQEARASELESITRADVQYPALGKLRSTLERFKETGKWSPNETYIGNESSKDAGN